MARTHKESADEIAPEQAAAPAARSGAPAAALIALQQSAGNRAVSAMVARWATARRDVASLQRVLMDGSGKQALSAKEVEQLCEDHPKMAEAVRTAHADPRPFAARSLRRGRLSIEELRAPSSSFAAQIPEGMLPNLSGQRIAHAGNAAGNPFALPRGRMPDELTEEVSQPHPTGVSYQGSDAIRSGVSLTDAGLDRTHHLSDSAIRKILVNIFKQKTWHARPVEQWFAAVAGSAGGALHKRFVDTCEAKLDLSSFERLSEELASSPWQIGLGRAADNRPAGERFDQSVTPLGRPTAVSSEVERATTALAVHGCVDEGIVKAALSQLIDLKTGEPLRSMVAHVEPGVPPALPADTLAPPAAGASPASAGPAAGSASAGPAAGPTSAAPAAGPTSAGPAPATPPPVHPRGPRQGPETPSTPDSDYDEDAPYYDFVESPVRSPAPVGPASYITPFALLSLGTPEKPPVAPGTHKGSRLELTQVIALLQIAHSDDAVKVLDRIQEGGTSAADLVGKIVFDVAADGTVTYTRPPDKPAKP